MTTIRKTIKRTFFLASSICLLFSCGTDEFEPYRQPFIHIMKGEISELTVSSEAKVLNEYKIYLSSAPLSETLNVEFSIMPGDGLTEGVDYEIVTAGHILDFLPGIYDMPVRVRWLPHRVDPAKDNSLIIRIENNSMNLTMGLPGSDQKQRELKITKTN